jgi:pyrroloquinoline quinone (PQQ) biosynthesis protein C
MPETLRRSAPFLVTTEDLPNPAGLRLDNLVVVPDTRLEQRLVERVAESLDLAAVAEHLPAEVAIEIVGEQYEACMDFMYSHPVWERFRAGECERAMLAYLLESRHYLHAAASRMAPGPSGAHRVGAARALAEHVVEEADHAVFFENGLSELGCDPSVMAGCRPSPVTLEWIYVMRALAARDPLVAGVCSGLMESTAADKDVIRGWHKMIVDNGLLTQRATDAIFEHIKLDMELGHGGNWQEVIEVEAPVCTTRLHEALNGACTVAEMLFRWFGVLDSGLSGDAVWIAPSIQVGPRPSPLDAVDPAFNGLPVWPAEILHQVTYGADAPAGARAALALAYHFDARVTQGSDALLEAANSIPRVDGRNDEASLETITKAWLSTIEGHRLWQQLERGSFPLIYGWLLENHHYLSAAVRHVAAAIAACPDPLIREVLVKHLDDEAHHADILRKGLDACVPDVRPADSRPLPTTAAFLGCLRDIAAADWKAYCLAIAFLQFTLSPGDPRHDGFYESALASCPEAKPLIEAIRGHDRVDIGGCHEEDIRRLLKLLDDRHEVDPTSIARASVIPQLAWSFLDGIRTHFVHGEVAIAQRLGWAAAR